MMETVTRKRYTKEFKAQAVGLVGIGKPVKDVARDLGISEGVLYEWVRKGSQAAQLGSAGPGAEGELSGADGSAGGALVDVSGGIGARRQSMILGSLAAALPLATPVLAAGSRTNRSGATRLRR